MKLSPKYLAASVVLALASVSAVAAPGPIPDPNNGPGGVILSVWDPVRGIGTTSYLGLTITQIQENTLTPDAGFVLSGSADLAVFGGNFSGVIYNVTAADFNGPTFSPLDWQLAFTTNSAVPTGLTGDNLSAGAASQQGFVGRVNQACGTSNGCNATSASDPQFPGGATFSTNLNAALPFDTTASIGTALAFYMMTGTSDILSDVVDVQRYANASSFGQWLLGENGTLTYSIGGGGTAPVPLPAAVWLLLSALGGVGVISRRKPAAAAA